MTAAARGRRAAALLFASGLAWGAEPQVIPVAPLPFTPALDGNLSEWGQAGFVEVEVKPAVAEAERAKLGLEGPSKNNTGAIKVRLRAGVSKDRFYLALRWPDDAPDAEYRNWVWRGTRYQADRNQQDDVLAVRFALDGQFDRSMLADRTYRADVWMWSAGRSAPAGYAEDLVHAISTQMIEDAAEYPIPGKGTVYIKKLRDAGEPTYDYLRPPKEKKGERLPSVAPNEKASGSVADVAAKGSWSGGHWHLELSRKLDTGYSDDTPFRAGDRIQGQIAVFNRAGNEHKSVSEVLVFDFSQLK